ncbi:pseudaminic acid biosynthesis-associated methylase [bacterium]|jgi:pseudaminic acid biosynthesis-associated methylase|nr:pseudaminic acid biosynthesis-associated methylase [bacterium]
MTDKINYKTEQEKFWAEEFGSDYINRNKGSKLLASNLNFFSKALAQADQLDSCIEFGANIGMNLKALKLLYPDIEMSGVEINKEAASELKNLIGDENVYLDSIFDWKPKTTYNLTLIKGVLIHINPNKLDLVYKKLYDASDQFILLCEYYNPAPVTINYRGYDDRLFKRDFAGEMLNKYPSLSLLDYGFSYHKDVAFPQDDITWFLMKKS